MRNVSQGIDFNHPICHKHLHSYPKDLAKFVWWDCASLPKVWYCHPQDHAHRHSSVHQIGRCQRVVYLHAQWQMIHYQIDSSHQRLGRSHCAILMIKHMRIMIRSIVMWILITSKHLECFVGTPCLQQIFHDLRTLLERIDPWWKWDIRSFNNLKRWMLLGVVVFNQSW